MSEQSLRKPRTIAKTLVKTAAKKTGRPSSFDQRVADIICIRLSEGESLRQICTDPYMPDRQTIYSWMLAHPVFLDQYTRAREEQAETLADEIVAIADEDPTMTEFRDRNGEVVDIKIDSGYVAYQKQRIEARKWTASKLRPKKYGDRVAVSGVEDGAPITTQDVTSSRLFELIKNAELKARGG